MICYSVTLDISWAAPFYGVDSVRYLIQDNIGGSRPQLKLPMI
jgi:hypothetical protein